MINFGRGIIHERLIKKTRNGRIFKIYIADQPKQVDITIEKDGNVLYTEKLSWYQARVKLWRALSEAQSEEVVKLRIDGRFHLFPYEIIKEALYLLGGKDSYWVNKKIKIM